MSFTDIKKFLNESEFSEAKTEPSEVSKYKFYEYIHYIIKLSLF